MSRRGAYQISWTALLSSVIVLLLIIPMFMLGSTIWQIFTGVDNRALNTYKLMGDNIESLLAAEEEGNLKFRFTYELEAQNNIVEGRESFKGTIFAIGNDRKIPDPIPPLRLDNAGETFADVEYDVAAISQKCLGQPCLCLSKQQISLDSTPEELRSMLENPHECRAFTIPEGVTGVTFVTNPKDYDIDAKSHPQLVIKKELPSPRLVEIEYFLLQQAER